MYHGVLSLEDHRGYLTIWTNAVQRKLQISPWWWLGGIIQTPYLVEAPPTIASSLMDNLLQVSPENWVKSGLWMARLGTITVVPELSWLWTEGPQSGDCHEHEAQMGDHVSRHHSKDVFFKKIIPQIYISTSGGRVIYRSALICSVSCVYSTHVN